MAVQDIHFSTSPAAGSALAYIVGENDAATPAFERLDSAALRNALQAMGFKPARGKTQILATPEGPVAIVGAGDLSNLDEALIESVTASLFHGVKSAGFEAVSLDLRGLEAALAARAVFALTLAAYRFDKYFGPAKQDKGPTLKKITVVCDDIAAAEVALQPLSAVAEGIL
ncbi:MAG: leucyl aminopeptidase, partial [Asticcacaulis sp.]|nr:leucyl aminopeptidase [Asticcacaulis sp.]